jgi:hypothetical protein
MDIGTKNPVIEASMTWGDTSLLVVPEVTLSLAQFPYQVHACLLPVKNQSLTQYEDQAEYESFLKTQ